MEKCKPKCDETRAEIRRQQVLDAASQCFREHGFHNAGMQLIARTAGMSVGHIYHYFENKEAIIAAIVAADEAITRSRFEGFRRESDVFRAMIDQADKGLDRCLDAGKSALLMEIVAESGRNPGVAAIVQASDRALCQQLEELMDMVREERHPGQPLTDTRARAAQAALIASVFDGLRVRAIRNPDLDRDAVLQLLRPVLQRILEG